MSLKKGVFYVTTGKRFLLEAHRVEARVMHFGLR
jgi:hypothetical protein